MSDSSEYLEAEQPATPLALPGQNLPDKLYVIPIHNRPFFPAQVLPVTRNGAGHWAD